VHISVTYTNIDEDVTPDIQMGISGDVNSITKTLNP